MDSSNQYSVPPTNPVTPTSYGQQGARGIPPKMIGAIVGILIVILLILGIIYLRVRSSGTPPDDSPTLPSSAGFTPTPTVTPDLSPRTHTDETYGFSFNYPATYIADTGTNYAVVVYDRKYQFGITNPPSITIWTHETKIAPERWLKGAYDSCEDETPVPSARPCSGYSLVHTATAAQYPWLGSLDAIEFYLQNAETTSENIVFQKDGFIYQIEAKSTPVGTIDLGAWEMLLTTFAFTK